MVKYKNMFAAFLRRAARWLLANVKPEENEIDQAIREAFSECGLNSAEYSPDFDLLHSGKLHEVLVHASNKIGNPLVYVSDLKELLS